VRPSDLEKGEPAEAFQAGDGKGRRRAQDPDENKAIRRDGDEDERHDDENRRLAAGANTTHAAGLTRIKSEQPGSKHDEQHIQRTHACNRTLRNITRRRVLCVGRFDGPSA
jgi:hypothetical protein